MSYHELSVAERTTIQIGLLKKLSQRRIARLLNQPFHHQPRDSMQPYSSWALPHP
jgi:IS30 family transposase